MRPVASALAQSSVRMRIISTEAELVALAAEWDELVSASGTPEFMLRPAWILNWWTHYSDRRTLCVGAFYDGATLIGLAPLCRRIFSYRLRLSFVRLEFMGASGQESDGLYSQYLSLIVRKGREGDVVEAFRSALLSGAFGAWEECVFEMMPGDHPLTDQIAAAFGNANVILDRRTVTQAYYLSPPPATFEAFLETQQGKRRKWFRKALRDFETWAGPEGFFVEAAVDRASLEKGMQILADLHSQRWREEDSDGVFASLRFWAFHKSFAAQMLERGQLDLMWLIVRDEPVAAVYSFIAEGKIYCYQCGRKMGVPKTVRLGIVMFLFSIQAAGARGLREYDFLGGHSGYKSQFTSLTRPLDEIRLARPIAKERLRRALTTAVRRMRVQAASGRERVTALRQRLLRPAPDASPPAGTSETSDN